MVNTAAGRRKERNMRERSMATVLGFNSNEPFRYLEVRGTVEEITKERGFAHINKLAKEYVGADSYYGGVTPTEMEGMETRVICKIKPKHVVAFAP